jgi:hypothetical protein
MKKVRSILLLVLAGLIGFSARRFGSPVPREEPIDLYRRSSYHLHRYPFLAPSFWTGSYVYQINKAKRSLEDLVIDCEKLRMDYKALQIKLSKCMRSKYVSQDNGSIGLR